MKSSFSFIADSSAKNGSSTNEATIKSKQKEEQHVVMKHTLGDWGPQPYTKMADHLSRSLVDGHSQMVIVLEDKQSMTKIDSPLSGLVFDICQSLLDESSHLGDIQVRAACGEIKKSWITNLLTRTKMQLIVDFETEQLVPNQRSTRSISSRKEMEEMIREANSNREGKRHSFIGLYISREYQGKLYRANFVLLNMVGDPTIIELGDCPKGNSLQKQKEQLELLCVEIAAKTDEEQTYLQSQSNVLTARFYDLFLTARVDAVGFESASTKPDDGEASLLDLTLECINKIAEEIKPKHCVRYIHETSTQVSHGSIVHGRFQKRYLKGGGVHPDPGAHHPSDTKKSKKTRRPSLAEMTRTNLKRLPEHLYYERRVLGRNRRKFDLKCPVTSKWASLWEQEMKANPIEMPLAL